MELVRDFCQPSSWEGVLKKYPKLYVNFAHFGGDGDFLEIDNPKSWSNVILKLMKEYDNVYADISYHDKALMKKTSGDYFTIIKKLLHEDLIKDRIIFGTDWLMTRHTWKEDDYMKAFMKLPNVMLYKITLHNPLNFLFPGKKLPLRIKNFFEAENINEEALPQWMKNNLEI